jgi:hypothetical protein
MARHVQVCLGIHIGIHIAMSLFYIYHVLICMHVRMYVGIYGYIVHTGIDMHVYHVER